MKAIIGTADHSSLNWLSQLEQHFLIQVSSTGDQLFEAVESGYFLQQPPELVVLAFSAQENESLIQQIREFEDLEDIPLLDRVPLIVLGSSSKYSDSSRNWAPLYVLKPESGWDDFASTLELLGLLKKSEISQNESYDPSQDPDLLILFRQEMEKRLIALKDAIQEKDMDAVERLAHKIKGTGATFGYPQISHLGAAIESAAKNKNLSTVLKNIEDLEKIATGIFSELDNKGGIK